MRVLTTLLFFLPLFFCNLNAQKVKLCDLDQQVVFIGNESPQSFENYQFILNQKHPLLVQKNLVYTSFPASEIKSIPTLENAEVSTWTKIEDIDKLQKEIQKQSTLDQDCQVIYLPESMTAELNLPKNKETVIRYIGEDKKNPEYLLISINPKEKRKNRAIVFDLGAYGTHNNPLGKEKILVFATDLGPQHYLVKVSKDEKWFLEHSYAFKLEENEMKGLSSL